MSRSSSPIVDFLLSYAASGASRFHMPGHKGCAPYGYPDFLKDSFPYDLTEIMGADELYEPEGIIAESERLTSEVFGSGESLYSAGGSTLSILTMVTAAVRVYGNEIIAVRNAHLSFANACVHCGADVHWLFPEYDQNTGLCFPVSEREISKAMEKYPTAKIVYLTSPDYYGVRTDIRAVAEAVHRFGGLLIVDNAHGAHLSAFTGEHPIAAGADICCDSPHKTLPVLTGGSLLHVRKGMENIFPKYKLKRIMTLYGSTSPSYLIMASLESASVWLKNGGKEDFLKLREKTDNVKAELESFGVSLLKRVSDCTKITIDAFRCGYTSDEMSGFLRAEMIEPEFSGGGKVVLMVSPQTSDNDYKRLIRFGKNLPILSPIPYPNVLLEPKKVFPIRQAVFSESEEINVSDSSGRIAAESRIACPPGIPVVVAGELIGDNEAKLLTDSGIMRISVVK